MLFDRFLEFQKKFPLLSWNMIQRVLKQRPQDQWLSDLTALNEGLPWEYLMKKADFGPLSIEIREPLLIPREETWDWVEKAFPALHFQSACDLGTGPGTLLLALAHFHGTHIDAIGVDIDKNAIEIARKNMQSSHLDHVEIIESDWGSELLKLNKKFDLILSNPPYCDISQKNWFESSPESPSARFAEFGGYAPYVTIFSQAQMLLSPDGTILLEHGIDQGTGITALASALNFKRTASYLDHNGGCRASQFRWKH